MLALSSIIYNPGTTARIAQGGRLSRVERDAEFNSLTHSLPLTIPIYHVLGLILLKGVFRLGLHTANLKQ